MEEEEEEEEAKSRRGYPRGGNVAIDTQREERGYVRERESWERDSGEREEKERQRHQTETETDTYRTREGQRGKR